MGDVRRALLYTPLKRTAVHRHNPGSYLKGPRASVARREYRRVGNVVISPNDRVIVAALRRT